jgi:hypothetical protein
MEVVRIAVCRQAIESGFADEATRGTTVDAAVNSVRACRTESCHSCGVQCAALVSICIYFAMPSACSVAFT